MDGSAWHGIVLVLVCIVCTQTIATPVSSSLKGASGLSMDTIPDGVREPDTGSLHIDSSPGGIDGHQTTAPRALSSTSVTCAAKLHMDSVICTAYLGAS